MPNLEKLYQLIMEVNPKFSTYWARKTAEHLLTNGVVVLPCRIGTTVYYADDETGQVLTGSVVSFESLEDDTVFCEIESDSGEFPTGRFLATREDFGKSVFLTRAEADKALKKMVGGDNNAQ